MAPVTNLLYAQQNVMAMIDKLQGVDMIFLDFSITFDLAQHRVLLAKMEALSILLALRNSKAAFRNHR